MGPSGSGKSSIQHSLPANVKFLTHYVTREVREDEINGIHVYHVRRLIFEQMIKDGVFATVTEYAGNLYGAPAYALDLAIQHNQSLHATATIESIKQFKEYLGDDKVVVIYIKAPSVEALRERMKLRGESDELIDNRIAHMYSAAELENEKFAKYVVVNDDLEIAKSTVIEIIQKELYGEEEEILL